MQKLPSVPWKTIKRFYLLHIHTHIMDRKYLIIGSVSAFAFIIAVLLLSALLQSPEVSADELNRQAYELRMKAKRGHCTTIGTKLAACYAGDLSACEGKINSETWFTNEYRETPEVSCASPDRPFGQGDGN